MTLHQTPASSSLVGDAGQDLGQSVPAYIAPRSGPSRLRPRYRSFAELLINSIRVDENGCWIWTKWINPKGYGVVHRTKDRPSNAAHRFVWENTRGPIPEGLHLDHLCRVRACVNPAHLEPVTVAENNRRSRHSVLRSHCRQGHAYAEHGVIDGGKRRCGACRREWQRKIRQETAVTP